MKTLKDHTCVYCNEKAAINILFIHNLVVWNTFHLEGLSHTSLSTGCERKYTFLLVLINICFTFSLIDL